MQAAGVFVAMTLLAGSPGKALAVQFSGYVWDVRPDGSGGPGPNHWDRHNAWVDRRGWLHLKISQRGAEWRAVEVTSERRFGFGRYEFVVHGPVDQLDPNVVLGLFNYPTPDVGRDGTNEVDIEYSHWGARINNIGNFTIYPTQAGIPQTSKTFTLTQSGSDSVQQFDWQSRGVMYQSYWGGGSIPLVQWTFAPPDFAQRVPQQPLPVHLNLWLFQGRPPTDGKGVEIVIRRFTFVPGVGAKPRAAKTP